MAPGGRRCDVWGRWWLGGAITSWAHCWGWRCPGRQAAALLGPAPSCCAPGDLVGGGVGWRVSASPNNGPLDNPRRCLRAGTSFGRVGARRGVVVGLSCRVSGTIGSTISGPIVALSCGFAASTRSRIFFGLDLGLYLGSTFRLDLRVDRCRHDLLSLWCCRCCRGSCGVDRDGPGRPSRLRALGCGGVGPGRVRVPGGAGRGVPGRPGRRTGPPDRGVVGGVGRGWVGAAHRPGRAVGPVGLGGGRLGAGRDGGV